MAPRSEASKARSTKVRALEKECVAKGTVAVRVAEPRVANMKKERDELKAALAKLSPMSGRVLHDIPQPWPPGDVGRCARCGLDGVSAHDPCTAAAWEAE